MAQVPDEEQFQAWLLDPVTQAYRRLLLVWRESLKSQWEAGSFNSPSLEETALSSSAASSESRMLYRLSTLSYEEFVGGLEDDE